MPGDDIITQCYRDSQGFRKGRTLAAARGPSGDSMGQAVTGSLGEIKEQWLRRQLHKKKPITDNRMAEQVGGDI